MRLSKETILEIKNLRKKGFSIPEISRECNRPKSTVSRHIKGVRILSRYYQRWLSRRNASKIISERNWQLADKKAKQLIDVITEKDLILMGISLYWAEGAKRDFTFSNTDAEMIRIFVYVLRKVFGIKDKDLKISLRIYEDLNKKTCLHYWSGIVGIKLGINTSVDILKGTKKGKLKYGMCRIRAKKSGLLLKEFFAIIKRVTSLTSPRSSTDRTRDS